MSSVARPIHQAVIAAAGLGTRFLPQTKAMPKEMLPIINKPIIQLITEELIDAGVTDILIVTGATKQAINDHFGRSRQLEDELYENDKGELANQLKAISRAARFTFIEQTGVPKGNARPILNAAHLLGNEPFFAFFGDNFFTGPVTRAKQMLQAYQETEGPIVSLIKVDRRDADKYGMVAIGDEVDNSTFKITQVVEKPGSDNAPSNFAACGGYILTPATLPFIANAKSDTRGEITLSSAVNEYAQAADVYGRLINGTYHDTGIPALYLQAIVDVALDDPELGDDFRRYLNERLKK